MMVGIMGLNTAAGWAGNPTGSPQLRAQPYDFAPLTIPFSIVTPNSPAKPAVTLYVGRKVQFHPRWLILKAFKNSAYSIQYLPTEKLPLKNDSFTHKTPLYETMYCDGGARR